MKWHSAADIFPMLGDADLAVLAQNIKENGLVEPIVTHEGCILDGRNRYRACEIAGVALRFVEWDGSGGSPTLYAISKNLHRRHLTLGQRAAIGVEMLQLLKAEAKKRQQEGGLTAGRGRPQQVPVSLPEPIRGDSRDLAAEAVQVGASSIGRAARVKAADPEAFERLKRGETTVNTEYRKVRKTPAPKPASKPASKSTGKRLPIQQNAQKRRMGDALAMMTGCCRGLSQINLSMVRAVCSEDEIQAWDKTAFEISRTLRKFRSELTGKTNDE